MDALLAEVLRVLDLETLDLDRFRGVSQDIGSGQIFGGQALGQSLVAATRTVDAGRVPHSLHGYFLRAGDPHASVDYEVERSRDGRSFSVRHVVGRQHGQAIFECFCSFQVGEAGLGHQAAMPDVLPPEDLRDTRDLRDDELAALPETVRRVLRARRALLFRPVELSRWLHREPQPPVKAVWVKTVEPLPEDPALHRAVLAYLSDYELLGTALLPHGLRLGQAQLQIASLDHALWFHHAPRVDQWMLYTTDSPFAGGARGLSRGLLFDRDGRLLASTAQEGLLRVR